MVLIAFFAILFTKKWPRGMFDFMVQIQRWTANVAAYSLLLLRDEYPPFSGDAGEYPVTLEVEYDENLSRWQIFLKWLFVTSHLIVLLFVVMLGLTSPSSSPSSRSSSPAATRGRCSTSWSGPSAG